MLLSDMQTKDIINTKDGNNLGRIIDAKIDNSGSIVYFVVEEKKLLRKVTRGGEITFSFDKIKKIGEDVILVDLWFFWWEHFNYNIKKIKIKFYYFAFLSDIIYLLLEEVQKWK